MYNNICVTKWRKLNIGKDVVQIMEKYSRGWRGAPAKGVGRLRGARVQIPLSPFSIPIWLKVRNAWFQAFLIFWKLGIDFSFHFGYTSQAQHAKPRVFAGAKDYLKILKKECWQSETAVILWLSCRWDRRWNLQTSFRRLRRSRWDITMSLGTLTNKQQCNLENSRDKDFQARSAWEDDWEWLLQACLRKDSINQTWMRKHSKIERGRTSLLVSSRDRIQERLRCKSWNQNSKSQKRFLAGNNF